MAVYHSPSYSGKSTVRPKQDIPESERNDTWYKENAEYIYSKHVIGESIFTEHDYKNINELRAYAKGRQSSERYKQWLYGYGESTPEIITSADDNEQIVGRVSAREGWMNVDFENILSVAPKYLLNLEGLFEDQNHETTVEAIDHKTKQAKETAKWKLWLESIFKKEVQTLQALGGGAPQEKALPQNLQELELYDKMGGFVERYETAMETAIRYTEEISDEPRVKRKVFRDLITIGGAATRDYVDPILKIVKQEYIDVTNCIAEFTDEDDFRRSRFVAYQREYTIEELKEYMPEKSEDELLTLANKWANMFGNSNQIWNGSLTEVGPNKTYGWENYRVPVLECYWRGLQRKPKEVEVKGKDVEKQVKKGKIKKDKDKYYKEIESESMTIQTIYQCYWVIGTDVVFNTGKMVDIPFDYYNKEARLPIHITKIPGKSLVETMKPVLDQIQMTYLNLQNSIAKAPPSGLAIDIDAINEVTMGNKKFYGLDLIKLRTHTGYMIYKGATTGGTYGAGIIQGQHFNQKPIEILHGGYDYELKSAIMSFEMCFQQLAELTGIDRTMAVSGSRDPEKSATETRIAVASSSNVLKPLYTNWLILKEEMAKNSAYRIPCLLEKNKNKDVGYWQCLSEAAIESLVEAYTLPHPVRWGFSIRPVPTQREKDEIRGASSAAFSQGAISLSEYLYLIHMLNTKVSLKYISAYIKFKEAQKAEQEAMRQEKIVMAQKEGEAQIKQMAAEIEKIKIMLETKKEVTVEKVKGDEARKTEAVKRGFNMDEMSLDNEHKKEQIVQGNQSNNQM